MPRLVDHGQRRAELLAAAWRVVRQRGVEGATTRAIAREAGCSLSVLAHFLGGKDDILVAAQRAIYDRIVARAFRIGGRPPPAARRTSGSARCCGSACGRPATAASCGPT